VSSGAAAGMEGIVMEMVLGAALAVVIAFAELWIVAA
jgi:hypothetical protein